MSSADLPELFPAQPQIPSPRGANAGDVCVQPVGKNALELIGPVPFSPTAKSPAMAEILDFSSLATIDCSLATPVPLLLPRSAVGPRNFYFACKRVVDVLLSAAAMLASFPLMLLIALAIKLESPGPVIFTQSRVSSRGLRWDDAGFIHLCTFNCHKFRSMRNGVDHTAHQQYLKEFIEGKTTGKASKFKLTEDRRLTRLGRILRKTSLDELPQLFNVLRGDMSLVGPRPVPEYEVQMYQRCHLGRLSTKPGITGLWQVRGRCQVPFEEMVQMDLEYVRTASLWLDFKILLMTLPAVLSMRGAE